MVNDSVDEIMKICLIKKSLCIQKACSNSTCFSTLKNNWVGLFPGCKTGLVNDDVKEEEEETLFH